MGSKLICSNFCLSPGFFGLLLYSLGFGGLDFRVMLFTEARQMIFRSAPSKFLEYTRVNQAPMTSSGMMGLILGEVFQSLHVEDLDLIVPSQA